MEFTHKKAYQREKYIELIYEKKFAKNYERKVTVQ